MNNRYINNQLSIKTIIRTFWGQNMKKIISLLLISMLLIVSCQSNNNNVNDASVNSDDDGNDNVEVEADNTENAQSSAKFKTINAAMAVGVPYKCTYSDKDFDSEIVIKGEKFKSETEMKEGTTYTISDGEKIYIWSNQQNDGIVYDLDEMKKMGETKTYAGAEQGPTDIEREYDIDCYTTTAPNSMFVPPSDINFQDMSQLLKNMQKDGNQKSSQE